MMSEPLVAIGGLGGSGTRLIADICSRHGINIGSCLNQSLDNLLFTLLFRRPSWTKEYPDDSQLDTAFQLFQLGMTVQRAAPWNRAQVQFLENLIDSNDTTIHSAKQWHELVDQIQTFTVVKDQPWGWKEPNTHVFLEPLLNRFPTIKYIHVIRDLAYMSQSKNQNQLLLWGKHYNVELPAKGKENDATIDYWLAANEKAIRTGVQAGPKRFYIVDYDKLSQNPFNEIPKLLAFLDVQWDPEQLKQICASVKYKGLEEEKKQQILAQMSPERLRRIAEVGSILENS